MEGTHEDTVPWWLPKKMDPLIVELVHVPFLCRSGGSDAELATVGRAGLRLRALPEAT